MLNPLRKACDKANSIAVALLALIGFLWLAYYSQHHETPAKPVTLIMEHGYTVADRQAMHNLLARVKHEKRLSRDDAEKLLAVYGGK